MNTIEILFYFVVGILFLTILFNIVLISVFSSLRRKVNEFLDFYSTAEEEVNEALNEETTLKSTIKEAKVLTSELKSALKDSRRNTSWMIRNVTLSEKEKAEFAELLAYVRERKEARNNYEASYGAIVDIFKATSEAINREFENSVKVKETSATEEDPEEKDTSSDIKKEDITVEEVAPPKNLTDTPVEWKVQTEWYSERMLRDNPDWLFIFGDNDMREGYGGQAKVCRDKPNTFGIVTVLFGNYVDPEATLQNLVWEDISTLKQLFAKGDFKKVIFPYDGIGTGIAKMYEIYPSVFRNLYIDLADLGLPLDYTKGIIERYIPETSEAPTEENQINVADVVESVARHKAIAEDRISPKVEVKVDKKDENFAYVSVTKPDFEIRVRVKRNSKTPIEISLSKDVLIFMGCLLRETDIPIGDSDTNPGYIHLGYGVFEKC